MAADATQQPDPVCSSGTCTVTYSSPNGDQPFTVPLGVTSLMVNALGASGGSYDNTYGGAGAQVNATLRVTPGASLTVAVGLGGGFNSDKFFYPPVKPVASGDVSAGWFQTRGGHGGGGGGASDVESGGTQLLVAGGGGGAGGSTFSGNGCFAQDFPGGTGGDSGLNGTHGNVGAEESSSNQYLYGGAGGGGGTALAPGGGAPGGGFDNLRGSGDNILTGCQKGSRNGTAGHSGNGRFGGDGLFPGPSGTNVQAGGGGGSGYQGGGAGGSGGASDAADAGAGGGGGGSSYVDATVATASSVTTGLNDSCRKDDCGYYHSDGTSTTGDGHVVLTYTLPAGTTAPQAPTSVNGIAGNTTAQVSFTPGSDGGEPAYSYTVLAVDVFAGGTSQTTTTASPVTVNGLTNGDKYFFYVSAKNAAGTGPNSAPSNAVTPFGPPSAPTNVAGEALTGAARVTFTPPSSDGFSPITGYTVTATNTTNTGQAPVTATGSASPIQVNGLLGSDTYTFTVTAANAAGSATSSPSSPVYVNGPVVVSGPPTNVNAETNIVGTISLGGGAPGYSGWEANVYFSPPASTGSYPIYNYLVLTHDETHPGASVAPVTGTSSPITVQGLTENDVYTFTVEPYTSDTRTGYTYQGADSAPSAPVIASLSMPGPPIATSASFTPTGPATGSARLVWNDPVTNVSVDGYNVYVGTSPGQESPTPVNATPVQPSATGATAPVTYDTPGLTGGTTYYFTVRAVSDGIASVPSNEVSTRPDVPSPPTQASRAVGDASVTLYWAAPTSDGGSPVTGYDVYEGTSPGQESSTPVNTTLLSADTFTYEADGLTPGATYYFTIEAANAVGLSQPTPELFGTAITNPGAPTNVTATPADGQVALTWSPPTTDGGSAIQGYDVYVGTASGRESGNAVNPSGSLGPDARSYTVTGLTDGTTYYFYVQAFNYRSGSLNTDEVSATPTGTPTPTDSPTGSPTPTDSPTGSPTPTDSPTGSPTPTDSPTGSPTPTDSPTGSPTPTETPTPTGSATPTGSPTPAGSATPTGSPTPTGSATPTGTPTPTGSATPSDGILLTPVPVSGVKVSIHAAHATITYGKTVKLTGTVTRLGLPVAGAHVTLIETYTGGGPQALRQVVSRSDGTWSYTTRPSYNGVITARSMGASASTSVAVRLTVSDLTATPVHGGLRLAMKLSPGFTSSQQLLVSVTLIDAHGHHRVITLHSAAPPRSATHATNHGVNRFSIVVPAAASTHLVTVTVSRAPASAPGTSRSARVI